MNPTSTTTVIVEPGRSKTTEEEEQAAIPRSIPASACRFRGIFFVLPAAPRPTCIAVRCGAGCVLPGRPSFSRPSRGRLVRRIRAYQRQQVDIHRLLVSPSVRPSHMLISFFLCFFDQLVTYSFFYFIIFLQKNRNCLEDCRQNGCRSPMRYTESNRIYLFNIFQGLAC